MPAPDWRKEDPEKSWQQWMDLEDEYSRVCRLCSNIEFERNWMLGRTSFGTKGIDQIPGFPSIPHPEYPDNGESIERWNSWIERWNSWIEHLRKLAMVDRKEKKKP